MEWRGNDENEMYLVKVATLKDKHDQINGQIGYKIEL